MPISLWPTGAEFARFLPEILLSIVATGLMVGEVVTGAGQKRLLGWVAFAGLFGAALLLALGPGTPGYAFQGMLVNDGFSQFFRMLALLAGAVVVLASMSYLHDEGHESGEYYSLMLFSVVGQCFMVSANELIMVFLGLEISSIASYVLAGFLRDDRRNNESAIKYFLLGSFATAFFLYGIAWIYGQTGTTSLTEIRAAIMTRGGLDPALLAVAAALLFIGLGFKVSAAPFQVWAPDVYQGAPAPVAAFLSAGPKAAAFAILIRLIQSSLSPVVSNWQMLLAVSALMTMLIGNFAALRQHNIKRMLGYSSIAHAGYVLVAVASMNELGSAAAMFYLAVYAAMNIGALSIVTHVVRKDEMYTTVEDFSGLAARQPWMAAALAIFLFSLIGVPLTGGFMGKFQVFSAALSSGLGWLAVLGLLSSGVAAYYYLRVVVAMYMREPGASVKSLQSPGWPLRFAVSASVVVVMAMGIVPSGLLDIAARFASLR